MAPPDGAGLGVAAGQAGAPLTVMLARESKISRFMGHGEEASRAGLFQEQVRRAWNNTPGITTAQKLDVILDNIGPNVRSEVKCLPAADRDDPEKLLSNIISIFGERRSPAQLWDVLRSCRQYPGEPVRSYSHRLMEAFDALQQRQVALGLTKEPDHTLLDQLVEGVQDATLSRYLAERRETDGQLSFIELRKIALRWARDEQPSTHTPTTSTPAVVAGQTVVPATTADVMAPFVEAMRQVLESNQRFAEQMLRNQQQMVDMLRQRPAPRPPQPPAPLPNRRGRQLNHQGRDDTCWSCHKLGHYARECPDKAQGNGPRQQ